MDIHTEPAIEEVKKDLAKARSDYSEGGYAEIVKEKVESLHLPDQWYLKIEISDFQYEHKRKRGFMPNAFIDVTTFTKEYQAGDFWITEYIELRFNTASEYWSERGGGSAVPLTRLKPWADVIYEYRVGLIEEIEKRKEEALKELKKKQKEDDRERQSLEVPKKYIFTFETEFYCGVVSDSGDPAVFSIENDLYFRLKTCKRTNYSVGAFADDFELFRTKQRRIEELKKKLKKESDK